MTFLVALVALVTAAGVVFLGLVGWAALDLTHSGMLGLFLVFALVYALGVAAGTAAALVLVRSRAAELTDTRVRALALVAVVSATAGSAGYFIGWFAGVLPSPA